MGNFGLVWFERYKFKLLVQQRNLYNYLTLSDVFSSISPFISLKKLNDNQWHIDSNNIIQNKQAYKKYIYKNTRFLVNQTDCKILVPLTQAASEWWGQGTRWCTAAKKYNYFNQYNQKAPLIIIIFKDLNNISRKFQLWTFTDDKQTLQFMDEGDAPVDVGFVKKNWKIFKPLMFWLQKDNKINLSYVPDIEITQSMCEQTVEKFGLQFIPERFLTQQICEQAVKKDWKQLELVPGKFLTRSLCLDALSKDSRTIQWTPKSFLTRTFFEKVVEQNASFITDVPEHFKSQRLYRSALEKSPDLLEFLHIFERNKDLDLFALKNGLTQLHLISRSFLYEHLDLVRLCVKNNGNALQFVPEEWIDQSICEQSVSNHNSGLKWIPERFITEEICNQSVKNCSKSLQYVPEIFCTQQMCWDAINDNPLNIEHVPFDIGGQEICMQALTKNPDLICYFHEQNLKIMENKGSITKLLETICRIGKISYLQEHRITPELKQIAEQSKKENLLWNIDQVHDSFLSYSKQL